MQKKKIKNKKRKMLLGLRMSCLLLWSLNFLSWKYVYVLFYFCQGRLWAYGFHYLLKRKNDNNKIPRALYYALLSYFM